MATKKKRKRRENGEKKKAIEGMFFFLRLFVRSFVEYDLSATLLERQHCAGERENMLGEAPFSYVYSTLIIKEWKEEKSRRNKEIKRTKRRGQSAHITSCIFIMTRQEKERLNHLLILFSPYYDHAVRS